MSKKFNFTEDVSNRLRQTKMNKFSKENSVTSLNFLDKEAAKEIKSRFLVKDSKELVEYNQREYDLENYKLSKMSIDDIKELRGSDNFDKQSSLR